MLYLGTLGVVIMFVILPLLIVALSAKSAPPKNVNYLNRKVK